MANLKRILPVAGLLLLPFCFYWKLFAWSPEERTVLEGLVVPAGSFYPLTYVLLPFDGDGEASVLALETYRLLHQGLAGVGTWLFLGSLGLGAGAAWIGAVLYMFTGLFASPVNHPLVVAASWIPLNLYLLRRSKAALAAGTIMMVLAGTDITKAQGFDLSPSFPDLYVGMGGFFLAAFGLIASRNRMRWLFAGIAGASLLLSFVFYPALGLFTLGTAVLVSYGMDLLLSGERRRLRWVVIGSFGLWLALAAWSVIVHMRLLASPGDLSPRQVEAAVSTVNWALVLTAVNAFILLAAWWRMGRRWPAWVLGALLVIDLGSFVKDRGQVPYETELQEPSAR